MLGGLPCWQAAHIDGETSPLGSNSAVVARTGERHKRRARLTIAMKLILPASQRVRQRTNLLNRDRKGVIAEIASDSR
jgi:hypothetical protein